MTKARPHKERELYLVADEILFNVWDALCLSIDRQYREEYLPYLPHVYDLLVATESGNDLWEYLVYIEETELGMLNEDSLTRHRATRVVDILLDYRNKLFSPVTDSSLPLGNQ